LQLSVTQENAEAFGVDFGAWAQAVKDPAYTRSIVTANGISQEGPVLRFGDVQRLDLIQFNVADYFWPPRLGQPDFGVSVSAAEHEVVPEPATWLLLHYGVAFHLLLSRRRFRRVATPS
jgi:hypothetical protein